MGVDGPWDPSKPTRSPCQLCDEVFWASWSYDNGWSRPVLCPSCLVYHNALREKRAVAALPMTLSRAVVVRESFWRRLWNKILGS